MIRPTGHCPSRRRRAVALLLGGWLAAQAALAAESAEVEPGATAPSASPSASPSAVSSTAPSTSPAAPSGELRLRWDARSPQDQGPLSAAHRLAPAVAAPAADSAVAEAVLRHRAGLPVGGLASGGLAVTLSGELLAWHERLAGATAGGTEHAGLRVDELQLSVDAGAWGASAGKKVLGWDVGFGFRPNDVVQQEARRTLLASPLEGRPLLQAEYFGADHATTLVWVNPQHLDAASADHRGADESALALRHYRHDGALDWHSFARWGEHTGASLGAAMAWVAGDAWAVHGSVRALQRYDAWRANPGLPGALARQSPWQPVTLGAAGQALLGVQWTGDAQQSLLVEAWHDGTAPSDADWRAWGLRNAALAAGASAVTAPAAARAANLAWQAGAFASTNLRRDNLFMRLAWQPARWQLALDALIHPADGGRTVTASVQWQGDRWRLDAALRAYGGPADSLLAQLPQRRVGVLAASWAF